MCVCVCVCVCVKLTWLVSSQGVNSKVLTSKTWFLGLPSQLPQLSEWPCGAPPWSAQISVSFPHPCIPFINKPLWALPPKMHPILGHVSSPPFYHFVSTHQCLLCIATKNKQTNKLTRLPSSLPSLQMTLYWATGFLPEAFLNSRL